MPLREGRQAPRDIVSLSDVLASISSIEREEAAVTSSLINLATSSRPVELALSRLHSLNMPLSELGYEASILRSRVSTTAHTARRVGERVHSLEEQMRRVTEANESVTSVLELKSSLSALHDAIEKHEWESATRLCARAMTVAPHIVNGVFAEKTVPTAELHFLPSESLSSSRKILRDVFLKNFRQSTLIKDAVGINRFFKLFPSIGWHEVGLDAYSAFAVDLVRTRAPTAVKTSSPLYYVTTLTALFESVCNIIVQHRPVVEKYYGPFKMFHVVERLVEECDVMVERLLEGWKEDKLIPKKLSDAAVSLSGYAVRSQTSTIEDESVDALEIDTTLNELSALSLRYFAFRRFVSSNFDESSDELSTCPQTSIEEGQRSPGMILMVKSASNRYFAALMQDCYIPLEMWYLRSTISRAHRTMSIDPSQSPPTSSIPDLVFYILRVVLDRIVNTGSIEAVYGCQQRIMDILKNDYINVLKQKLDDAHRSLLSTKMVNSDRENRFCCVVFLNDLQVSVLHMARITNYAASSGSIRDNFIVSEVPLVRQYFHELEVIGQNMQIVLNAALDQSFNQLIRPRLRTFLTDIYKDVSYVLDEDGYRISEQHDHVRKRFSKNWEEVMHNLKETMAESNYVSLFDSVVNALVRPWEKRVCAMQYTELGAVRFDHDIRSVITYLTGNANVGNVRKKFQKLQQISTLLNIDQDENLEEFYGSSGIDWKMNLAEARAVIELKI